MSEAKKGNKVLLYYNAYSGSGVFKNNLDYIVERCQEEGFQVVPVRASKGYVIEETLANLDQNEYHCGWGRRDYQYLRQRHDPS